MEAEDVEGVGAANRSTDYRKVATAIGNMQSDGVQISLPNINQSDFGFKVDLEGDRILFGLKGITRIGDDLVHEIMGNRPYTSMADFQRKVDTNVLQMLNLIKAGCFDELEQEKPRETIMREFVWSVSNPRNRLTLQNFNGLIEADLVPEELDFPKSIYNYTSILRKHFRRDGYYHFENEQLLEFYEEHFNTNWLEAVDGNYAIPVKDFDDNIYQVYMDEVREWLNNEQEEVLEKYNQSLFKEQWDKYGVGNKSSWEMDSVSFYYHEHELAHVNREKYDISDFSELPFDAEIDYTFFVDGKEIPIFKTSRIVGTVISKEKANGTINLLTTEEVVTVRFRRPFFAAFDKQLSESRSDGTKRITERSWFNKGNKLMLTGYRREDQFVPKTYARTPGKELYLIEEVDSEGNLKLRSER